MRQEIRHFDHLDPRAMQPSANLFSRLRMTLLGVAVLGIAGCVAGWASNPQRFYFSYLTGYLFSLTLVLGMLFFVMLHHVTDAGWSVVVRRSAEQTLAALPLLAMLFIPIVIGTLRGQIYDWVHAKPDDHLLHAKQPFLNLPFFFGRMAGYFVVWFVLSRFLRHGSLKQDQSGNPALTLSMRRISAPGLLLYAVTFTFAMIDWIMTLDYHWFSTVFGVYVWSGSVATSLALLTLIILALSRGPLAGLVLSDHVHDLGKLVFAFSVFWAYIAFSQYFLIWYSNIPEETIWFLHRWTGTADHPANWWIVSLILPLGRFLLPFVVLMSASAKRSPKVLVVVGIVLLAVHYIDLYWMILPTYDSHGPPLEGWWMDLAALLAVGGASGFVILRAMARSALYPFNDPRIQECLMGEHWEEVEAAEVE